ncbi:MAG TPA: ABC transporter substrate-binding protein [Verrucomicrobiae bacterium]|nr:ABC transporter substrate-binding protein [Verrucomicrobiae bacterium]
MKSKQPYQPTGYRFRLRSFFLLAGLLAVRPPTWAQTNTGATKPYATIDRESVAYRGPVRASPDTKGAAVIGMILPLTGALQAEGNTLLVAARLAVEQENAVGRIPGGKLELAVRDENGPWGQTSMEILKLYDQDHAVAILTSANGASAHLAEQIANKISIPILTLASDPSTTQANVPWLFRLGPSDTDQAQAFCQRIYRDLALKQVLLIAQTDHDGRAGAAEFEKSAKTFHAPPPHRLDCTDAAPNSASLEQALRANSPDAIVVWSDSPFAGSIMPILHAIVPATPVFFCRKATQVGSPEKRWAEQLTIDSMPDQDDARSKFQTVYFARAGVKPSEAAYEIARGIHAIAEGLRVNGTNRVLLRDYLANEPGSRHGDAAISVNFDAAGNDVHAFAVVKLLPVKP